MDVVVIDYGMGNVWSVLSALRYLGVNANLVSEPAKIAAARTLILPGVGSFRTAMEALRERRIEPALLSAVQSKQAKILGICLGMQLLGAHGSEDGDTRGLALVPNRIDQFTSQELGTHKSPHIGFNQVRFATSSGLFHGLASGSDFYFVHSYRMLPEKLVGEVGLCTYGVDFVAAFHFDNVYGAQFHPEKSQANGLVLLKNFLEAPLPC